MWLTQPDDGGPLDISMFQDLRFRDAFRVLPVYFRIIGSEEDPEHPTRPRLVFAGEVRDGESMIGRIEMTPDEHLRWKWVRLRVCILATSMAYNFSRCAERAGRQSGGIAFYPLWSTLNDLIDHIITPLVVTASRSVGYGRLTVSSEAGRQSSTITTIQSVSSTLLLRVHSNLSAVTTGPFWLHKVKTIWE